MLLPSLRKNVRTNAKKNKSLQDLLGPTSQVDRVLSVEAFNGGVHNTKLTCLMTDGQERVVLYRRLDLAILLTGVTYTATALPAIITELNLKGFDFTEDDLLLVNGTLKAKDTSIGYFNFGAVPIPTPPTGPAGEIDLLLHAAGRESNSGHYSIRYSFPETFNIFLIVDGTIYSKAVAFDDDNVGDMYLRLYTEFAGLFSQQTKLEFSKVRDSNLVSIDNSTAISSFDTIPTTLIKVKNKTSAWVNFTFGIMDLDDLSGGGRVFFTSYMGLAPTGYINETSFIESSHATSFPITVSEDGVIYPDAGFNGATQGQLLVSAGIDYLPESFYPHVYKPALPPYPEASRADGLIINQTTLPMTLRSPYLSEPIAINSRPNAPQLDRILFKNLTKRYVNDLKVCLSTSLTQPEFDEYSCDGEINSVSMYQSGAIHELYANVLLNNPTGLVDKIKLVEVNSFDGSYTYVQNLTNQPMWFYMDVYNTGAERYEEASPRILLAPANTLGTINSPLETLDFYTFLNEDELYNTEVFSTLTFRGLTVGIMLGESLEEALRNSLVTSVLAVGELMQYGAELSDTVVVNRSLMSEELILDKDLPTQKIIRLAGRSLPLFDSIVSYE